MKDEHEAHARELHDEFQRQAGRFLAPAGEDDDLDLPTAGVLTGWFLVCEWMGDDGQSWLTYKRPPEQTTWRSRGLLIEAERDT